VFASFFFLILNSDKKKNSIPKIDYYSKVVAKPKSDFENEVIVYLSGIHVSGRKSYILNNCYEGITVDVLPDPKNKFDPEAIKVIESEKLIGFIPSDKTDLIKPIITQKHKATIFEMREEDSYTNPGKIHLTVYLKIEY
jgi:hypothetical protein